MGETEMSGKFWVNIRNSELPWHKTFLAAALNIWRKVRGARRCCGHGGHPGC